MMDAPVELGAVFRISVVSLAGAPQGRLRVLSQGGNPTLPIDNTNDPEKN